MYKGGVGGVDITDLQPTQIYPKLYKTAVALHPLIFFSNQKFITRGLDVFNIP